MRSSDVHDREGLRRSALYKYTAEYFPIRLARSTPLDNQRHSTRTHRTCTLSRALLPMCRVVACVVRGGHGNASRQYIFGVHPHGIIPTFVTVSMMTQVSFQMGGFSR
jgi:hypothetical protein